MYCQLNLEFYIANTSITLKKIKEKEQECVEKWGKKISWLKKIGNKKAFDYEYIKTNI